MDKFIKTGIFKETKNPPTIEISKYMLIDGIKIPIKITADMKDVPRKYYLRASSLLLIQSEKEALPNSYNEQPTCIQKIKQLWNSLTHYIINSLR